MKKHLTNLVIAVAAIGIGISMSMKPWRVYATQKRATEQQVQEMKQVEKQHVEDLQKEAKYSGSVGREELARSQGWHRKGEVPAGN